VPVARARKGFCPWGLESTKAIKSQVAESLYVAYDDAASQRATELA